MTHMISHGVRDIDPPDDVSVFFPSDSTRKVFLNVFCEEKEHVELLPISKRVAEVLIANGMDYQG